MSPHLIVATVQAVGVLAVGALLTARSDRHGSPATITVTLSEWSIQLSEATVPTGQVAFTVTNDGSVPHALEIEGRGIERKTPLIQPGASDTLTLTLKPGTYEVYCPVGEDSHKKLGMATHLEVVGPGQQARRENETLARQPAPATRAEPIRVAGRGAVIQILPGPFPFPDSVRPILSSFGTGREALEGQMQNGPYSNNVTPISGTFALRAWDRGATRDSVDGVAEFVTQDGARWKVVLDRLQTTDAPRRPKFGGVIRGLYYHGATGVHTPLVPTINSAVALWSVAHLYRNGERVTDSAYVHVMLVSRTRRDKDFALACWDCSKNKIEELQLQVTAAPGGPKLEAPGGVLFVNWQESKFQPAMH